MAINGCKMQSDLKGMNYMNKNRETKKLPGFYIALCCCVIAIGAAGFVIQSQPEPENTEFAAQITPEPETELIDVTQPPFEEPETEVFNEELTQQPPTEPEPVIDYTYNNPDIAPASVVVNAEEAHKFCDPLTEMSVVLGYSPDTLLYNDYYGDWRTHNGIDLSCAVGCSVNAVASGTVKSIANSSYGKTVTIEHSDGFVSVYAQLGEVNVSEGESVEGGSVIGTVSESIGESTKEAHLHFELIKDGKCVNPTEY